MEHQVLVVSQEVMDLLDLVVHLELQELVVLVVLQE